MKKEILDTINIKRVWKIFNVHHLRPEELNDQEAVFITIKNSAYEGDWSLPEHIEGWVCCTAWFNNMVAGQPGRRGSTRLQWRPDMGKPIILDGYHNDNHGANLWFVPKVHIGGNYAWQIRAEIEFSDRGQPTFARLFAEKKGVEN